MKAAAIQMNSGAELRANLDAAEQLLGQAAAAGATFAVLPENFAYLAADEAGKLAIAEDSNGNGVDHVGVAVVEGIEGEGIAGNHGSHERFVRPFSPLRERGGGFAGYVTRATNATNAGAVRISI